MGRRISAPDTDVSASRVRRTINETIDASAFERHNPTIGRKDFGPG